MSSSVDAFARITPGSWTCTLLPFPKGRPRSRGLGYWGDRPVAYAEAARGGGAAYVWLDDGPREISVPGAESVSVVPSADESLPGQAVIGGVSRAVVIRLDGGGIAYTDLHDPRFESTTALACAGRTVVGAGTPAGRRQTVGLVWKVSGGTPEPLDGPDPDRSTEARATDGTWHAGAAGMPARAVAWRAGSPAPLVLASPRGSNAGAAGVDGGRFTGTIWTTMENCRAAFWPTAEAPWVDLTPKGFACAEGRASAAGLQTGWAYLDRKREVAHAVLWGGAASRFTDLHAFVPNRKYNFSRAAAIRVAGPRVSLLGSAGVSANGAVPVQQACRWDATLEA